MTVRELREKLAALPEEVQDLEVGSLRGESYTDSWGSSIQPEVVWLVEGYNDELTRNGPKEGGKRVVCI